MNDIPGCIESLEAHSVRNSAELVTGMHLYEVELCFSKKTSV